MIISCVTCSAKYMIPTESIGDSGRKVKCAKCSNVWIAKLTDEQIKQSNDLNKKQDQRKENKSNMGKIKLPKITNTKTPTYLKILPIALLLCLILTVMVFFDKPLRQIESIKSIYEIAGVKDKSSFVINNPKIKIIFEDGQKNYYMKFDVVNDYNKIRRMPYVKLSVLDSNFLEIVSHVTDLSERKLGPGHSMEIKEKLHNMAHNARYISFDIGDKLQMYFR